MIMRFFRRLDSTNTYAKMTANENVYYINVANQRSLPTTVFCLKFLQEFYVRNTDFYESDPEDDTVRKLPSGIDQLASSLRYLSISDTPITHLPEQIEGLTSLTYLQLYNTGLVVLPDSIGNLSRLITLILDHNKLTSLPMSIANLQGLKILSLRNNLKLRSIQPLNGLPYLYYLHASNCAIERLPANLPYMGSLDMSSNNLTDLINIGSLGNSSTLNYFYFSKNYIRYIPASIRYIRYLYSLDLDNNELPSLPTELFNMTSLRSLRIRNNLFSGSELKAIVTKFNQTNPSLALYWI